MCIRRLVKHSKFFGPQAGAISRWVRRKEVLGMIKGEARLWPNAAGLKGVCDEREGKKQNHSAPVFWTVGVDQIPKAEGYSNG